MTPVGTGSRRHDARSRTRRDDTALLLRRSRLALSRLARAGRRRRGRFDVAFYVPWISPLLTSGDPPPTGGAETQVFLLARALARRGVRVRLLAFELPGHTIPASIDGVTISLRAPYRAHRRLGTLREAATLFRTVLSSRAHVVVTRAAGPHVGVAALAAKLSRSRFAYSSANTSDFDSQGLESRRRNDLLFRVGIHLADRIVVQTQEQVRLCRERFGVEPVCIGSIAEPAARREGVPEAFLWVGRLVWYKRPLAYLDLARSLPDARFWMVGVPVPHTEGGDALAAELEHGAAALPNVELLPPLPRERLLEIVGRAVAVVNTSDFEGMPNVFLEGWARGVPALALTHDPDGVIGRHGLGGFAQGSPSRFSELASEMWADRGRRSDVTARCAAYIAEHHSSDSVGALWEEALGVASDSSATAETGGTRAAPKRVRRTTDKG